MAVDRHSSELNRTSQWVVLAFFLAALGIRLLLLGSKSLWLDEALSLRIALAGQAAFWSGKVEIGHPPLSFWLLEQWAQLGRSEFVLRLPSAILGSLSVLLIYVLAKDVADRPDAKQWFQPDGFSDGWRKWLTWIGRGISRGRQHTPWSLGQHIETSIRRDLVQPRPIIRPCPHTRIRSKRTQERLLQTILGIVRLAQHTPHIRENLRAVPFHQLFKVRFHCTPPVHRLYQI